MSEPSVVLPTRPPARWQDGVEAVVGAVVALTPLWFATSTGSTWAMVVLGVLVAVGAIASLSKPGFVYLEWIQMALAFLLFIAPWVIDYVDLAGAAWTSWLAGLVIALTAFMSLPAANAAQAASAE